jgi:hypothetical protein
VTHVDQTVLTANALNINAVIAAVYDVNILYHSLDYDDELIKLTIRV